MNDTTMMTDDSWLPAHVFGTDIQDAIDFLQFACNAGYSGRLTFSGRVVMVRAGRLTGDELNDVVAAVAVMFSPDSRGSYWTWRRVPGLPEGQVNVSLDAVLLSVA